jgi:transmembrane sensor
MSTANELPRSVLDEASLWRIRIEADLRVAESCDFLAWIAAPGNKEAYARVSATWDAFEDHLASPHLIAVRRDALERVRRASLSRFVRVRPWREAVAAGILLTIGLTLGTWHFLASPAEYMTGTGERRVVVLNDGSRLSLDSDTAVQARYTNTARELVLERGRARFDVAHDIRKPFTVTAGGETVVAVGTSFEVEKLEHKVLVTLLEGRIVVKPATDGSGPRIVDQARREPVALKAGEELIASIYVKPKIVAANLPVATAWEAGRLILNDEPLGEAVERINRYTDKPLLVDPAVAHVRVSGVFNAGDTAAFVDAITNYFPIQASANDQDQTVLQKRS